MLRQIGRVWDPSEFKFKDVMVDESISDEEVAIFLDGLKRRNKTNSSNN